MASLVMFVRNLTFSRIHSAHSRAMAFWVSSFRRRISNGLPHKEASLPRLGMKYSRDSFAPFSGTAKVGEVKRNRSSSICASCAFNSRKA